jgi:hypothetical protein
VLCHVTQESAFEELFDAPTLNSSRWILSSMDGLFHCDKGSAHFVRAAGRRSAARTRGRRARGCAACVLLSA